MAERFFAADLHLGHAGMIMFESEGRPIRPWGRPVGKKAIELGLMTQEEADERLAAHDEAIIDNWNRVVGPNDKVEVLGDVIIGRSKRDLLGRLNGKKRLRMGNHDIFVRRWNEDYKPYFEEITAYKVFDDLICSHIPLHPASVKERWKANVHGHLHTGRVMMPNPARVVWDHADAYGVASCWGPQPPAEIIDPRYLCVSMEHISFTPIPMDEVYRRIEEQQENMDV